eukprot:SAG11_NODE_4442_length_1893_cov_1.697324_1_plen_164_part_00
MASDSGSAALQAMSMRQLKERLRASSLPTLGPKADLIDRLLKHQHSSSTESTMDEGQGAGTSEEVVHEEPRSSSWLMRRHQKGNALPLDYSPKYEQRQSVVALAKPDIASWTPSDVAKWAAELFPDPLWRNTVRVCASYLPPCILSSRQQHATWMETLTCSLR